MRDLADQQTGRTAFIPLSPSQHVICSALSCPHHTDTRTHIRHMTPAPWTPATHHLTQFVVAYTQSWK